MLIIQQVTEPLRTTWRGPAVACFALLTLTSALTAQVTVFVARHADRGSAEPDPPVTDLGFRQAETLGELLRNAGVTHIYTTEFLRTQQTAAPTARISGVAPQIVKQDDLEQLITSVRSHHIAGEAILVVGHRATVPRIVKALTGKDIEPLGSSECNRLLVLT